MICAISFTYAPSSQRSHNAGSDGSDMLLAVPRANSSVASSTRCRLRYGARSEVVSLRPGFVAVQEAVNQVQRFAVVVNLRRNASKTKVLSVHADPPLHQAIDVAGEPHQEVSSLKYLGASFTATGQAIGEMKARIYEARAALNRLQPSLWSRP